MAKAAFLTISSFLAKPPPPADRRDPGHRQLRLAPPSSNLVYNRRNVVLVSFLCLSLMKPLPAAAFSWGISGPKEWLKEQKRKASRFLLAPIDASRKSLHTAYLLLAVADTEPPSVKDVEQVQRLVKAASRDCLPQERSSFVAFQSQTGVEVCTFRLIVKNASSLLDARSPAKLDAEAKLSDLIRSFTFLNDVAKENDLQVASVRKCLETALMDTISSLHNFEQAIQDCLIL